MVDLRVKGICVVNFYSPLHSASLVAPVPLVVKLLSGQEVQFLLNPLLYDPCVHSEHSGSRIVPSSPPYRSALISLGSLTYNPGPHFVSSEIQ